MSLLSSLALVAALAAPVAPGQQAGTFLGVITDSMCHADHQPMNVSPDEKCVRECVRDASTYKYALTDGKRTYLLSDQQTPEQFAGKRVKVTGVLYPKTNIIKVETIEAVK